MKKVTGWITVTLVVATLAGLFLGATWQSLVMGLMAILSAILWFGEMEKEGTLG